MEGGYIGRNNSAHVWGRLEVQFVETCNCLNICAYNKHGHKEELFNLFLSGESDDAIEQLGVIIDGCQDAINHLRSKQLESETLGTQPDSYKIDDAMEAQQAAHEMAQADDDEVLF